MSSYDIHTKDGQLLSCDDYKFEGNKVKYIEPYTHTVKEIPAANLEKVVECHKNIIPILGALFEAKF